MLVDVRHDEAEEAVMKKWLGCGCLVTAEADHWFVNNVLPCEYS